MKQGSGSSRSAPKQQPSAKAVNVAAVSQMGNKQGNHSDRGAFKTKREPLYAGRGIAAPSPKVTNHAKGSQGRH